MLAVIWAAGDTRPPRAATLPPLTPRTLPAVGTVGANSAATPLAAACHPPVAAPAAAALPQPVAVLRALRLACRSDPMAANSSVFPVFLAACVELELWDARHATSNGSSTVTPTPHKENMPPHTDVDGDASRLILGDAVAAAGDETAWRLRRLTDAGTSGEPIGALQAQTDAVLNIINNDACYRGCRFTADGTMRCEGLPYVASSVVAGDAACQSAFESYRQSRLEEIIVVVFEFQASNDVPLTILNLTQYTPLLTRLAFNSASWSSVLSVCTLVRS